MGFCGRGVKLSGAETLESGGLILHYVAQIMCIFQLRLKVNIERTTSVPDC